MARAGNILRFPTFAGDGQVVPAQLSPRMRTELVDAAFFATGGFERFVAWIGASDDNYATFIKDWMRGQVRSTNVDLNVSHTVEDAIKQLDAEEDRLRASAEDAEILNKDDDNG